MFGWGNNILDCWKVHPVTDEKEDLSNYFKNKIRIISKNHFSWIPCKHEPGMFPGSCSWAPPSSSCWCMWNWKTRFWLWTRSSSGGVQVEVYRWRCVGGDRSRKVPKLMNVCQSGPRGLGSELRFWAPVLSSRFRGSGILVCLWCLKLRETVRRCCTITGSSETGRLWTGSTDRPGSFWWHEIPHLCVFRLMTFIVGVQSEACSPVQFW